MPKGNTQPLLVVGWNDVRDSVRAACEAAQGRGDENVYALLDAVAQSETKAHPLPVFRAVYKFGERVAEAGKLRLPSAANDRAAIAQFKSGFMDHAHFDSIPLSLVLSNAVEVYYEHSPLGIDDDADKTGTDSYRVVPQRILRRGMFFGLSRRAIDGKV